MSQQPQRRPNHDMPDHKLKNNHLKKQDITCYINKSAYIKKLETLLSNVASNNIACETIHRIISRYSWPPAKRYTISILSVHLSYDNFQKPLCWEFIFARPVYLHWIQVKVTRAKMVQNPIVLQCKTTICNNFGSVKHSAMKFACSLEFLDMADRMVWPHLRHVTRSDHT